LPLLPSGGSGGAPKISDTCPCGARIVIFLDHLFEWVPASDRRVPSQKVKVFEPCMVGRTFLSVTGESPCGRIGRAALTPSP
jgi:hypothetical protein